MIRWLFIMPMICLLDYINGIFDEDFRNEYLDAEGNMLEHMKIERAKRVVKSLNIALTNHNSEEK